jgi:hypothetical protein
MNILSYKTLIVGVIAAAALACCFTTVFPALAESDPTSFSDGLSQAGSFADSNDLGKARSTKEILQSIVKWLLSLVGTIAVISLIYGGFLYVTSQGEENQTEKAKNIILYSVIGIIIIGISAIVVNVVISITQQ